MNKQESKDIDRLKELKNEYDAAYERFATERDAFKDTYGYAICR